MLGCTVQEAVQRVSLKEYRDWLRYWRISPPLETRVDALIQVAGRMKKPVRWYEPEADKTARIEFVFSSVMARAPKRTREEIEAARLEKKRQQG